MARTRPSSTRWLAVFAALALWGCDVKIQRGDLPEAPPPDLAAKGLNPAYTVLRFPDKASLDAYCRANGVDAHDEYVQRRLEACVVPIFRTVALPAEGTMDPVRLAADTVHEYAHSWGVPHYPDGRGWVGWTGDGVPLLASTGQPTDTGASVPMLDANRQGLPANVPLLTTPPASLRIPMKGGR